MTAIVCSPHGCKSSAWSPAWTPSAICAVCMAEEIARACSWAHTSIQFPTAALMTVFSACASRLPLWKPSLKPLFPLTSKSSLSPKKKASASRNPFSAVSLPSDALIRRCSISRIQMAARFAKQFRISALIPLSLRTPASTIAPSHFSNFTSSRGPCSILPTNLSRPSPPLLVKAALN